MGEGNFGKNFESTQERRDARPGLDKIKTKLQSSITLYAETSGYVYHTKDVVAAAEGVFENFKALINSDAKFSDMQADLIAGVLSNLLQENLSELEKVLLGSKNGIAGIKNKRVEVSKMLPILTFANTCRG